MDDSALVERWQAIWAEPVRGWDFSSFGGRIEEEPLPWSYDDLAREALDGASSVLDLGTGGGELLLSLRDALPEDVVATEGWETNVPVARAALAPIGVDVVAFDTGSGTAMPFPDERFEVVLSRHEAYDAREVARVLTPGGRLLTQQVEAGDLADLVAVLGGPPAHPDPTLAHERAAAEAAGLEVDLAEEWSGAVRFSDVDTLVGYLAKIPWAVEGFSVATHAAVLLRLHRDSTPLGFTQRRFVLGAHRPRRPAVPGR
jgi:SAM-dependent methyltransferase